VCELLSSYLIATKNIQERTSLLDFIDVSFGEKYKKNARFHKGKYERSHKNSVCKFQRWIQIPDERERHFSTLEVW